MVQILRMAVPRAKATKVSINPLATPYDKVIAQARAGLQTIGQGRNTANQQVTAQINAGLGASNASSRLEQDQFKDLQTRAMGFASALGDLQAKMAPSVGQAYQNAAQALGSYGTGLTGAVAADEEAAAAKAREQVSGLIGGGNAGLVGGYDIPGLRSTAQYTGVTLPAAGLGEQAATAVRLANAATTTAYGGVESIAKDYAQQAIDALNQRAAERAKIIAQRPELFQTALAAEREDRSKTLSTLATLTGSKTDYLTAKTKAKSDAAQQAIENKRAADQLAVTQSYFGLAGKKAVADWTGRDPTTGQLLPGYVQDPKTGAIVSASTWYAANAPGAYSDALSKQRKVLVDSKGKPIPDANGNPIPYVPARGASKSRSGGLSASKRQTIFNEAKNMAVTAKGAGGIKIQGVDLGGGGATVDFGRTYNQLISFLLGSGYTNLNNARGQALKAMGAAGWAMPGQVDVAP